MNTTKEIIKARAAIKQKYMRLKRGELNDEAEYEFAFKPITKPLKELLNKAREKENNLKMEGFEKKESEISQPVEEEVWYTDEDEPQEEAVGVEGDIFEETNDLVGRSAAEEERYEKPANSFQEPLLSEESYGKLADSFLKPLSSNVDIRFGIRRDISADMWLIGDAVVEISDNDIYIEGNKYKGTSGLFHLLTREMPNPKRFTKKDLDVYKKILDQTNAHKRHFHPEARIAASRSYKYTDIIRPLFSKKIGEGFKTLKNSVDYVYWDNANELIERLKLLISSRNAGNNSHENEIISIIEELKEAKIIK